MCNGCCNGSNRRSSRAGHSTLAFFFQQKTKPDPTHYQLFYVFWFHCHWSAWYGGDNLESAVAGLRNRFPVYKDSAIFVVSPMSAQARVFEKATVEVVVPT